MQKILLFAPLSSLRYDKDTRNGMNTGAGGGKESTFGRAKTGKYSIVLYIYSIGQV